jgi:3-oxoacyl-[acyl-carrier protein] reductase
VVADLLEDAATETADEIVKAGGKAVAVAVNVADVASTQALAERTVEAFGRIDILVNNAALWGDLQAAPVTATPPDYWDKVMAVNLKGPLLCAQAVLPQMKANRWGRIVNISSMGALMRGGAYSVSKMALNQLTFQMAHEVGEFGVTVNAVGPGPTHNEATKNQVSEQGFQFLVQQLSVKRAGTAADYYAAMRYLCSDAAGWFTGQTMYVNGGFNTSF